MNRGYEMSTEIPPNPVNIVYALRHGSYGYSGRLIPKGVEEVKASILEIKQELESKGIAEIQVYHSPATRAFESAVIAREVLLPIKVILEQRDELNPESISIDKVVETAKFPCIIIGHKPQLKDFIEKHTGKEVDLEKGKYVKVGTKNHYSPG